MQIVVSENNHCDLVEINGRIDSYSTPQIEAVLKTLITEHHYNIIVDFKNVNFISSSGILAFVKSQRGLKRQNKGKIVFIRVPKLVLKSFEIAGFDTVFNFFNDFDTAMGSF